MSTTPTYIILSEGMRYVQVKTHSAEHGQARLADTFD